GAADLQIGTSSNAEGSADEVHIVCGVHSEIQRYVLGEPLRRRRCDSARELIDETRQVKRGREGKLGHVDVAAEACSGCRTGEAEIGVDTFPHALRIEHANVPSGEPHIELNGGTQRDSTLGRDLAPADLALKTRNVDPVLCERKGAVAVFKADRE